MKRLIAILFMCAVTLGAYASFFEVQVAMSEKRAYGEKVELTDGHFHTTIQPIDDFGHAYSPGQSTSGGSYSPNGPRRVGHKDDEDDPFMPSQVAPVGDIPWILLAFLMIVYIATIVPRTHSRRTFKLLLSHLSRVEQWRKILKK